MTLPDFRCWHETDITPPSLQADYVKALIAGCIAFLCASLSFFCFGQVPLGSLCGLAHGRVKRFHGTDFDETIFFFQEAILLACEGGPK